MSNKTNSGKAQSGGLLRLVSFRKELFPVSIEDFELLRDRGVSVSRINKDAFLILRTVFLKGIKVEVIPWADLFVMLMEHFRDSFDPEVFELRQEGSTILIHTDSILTEHIKFLDSQVKLLQGYAGRYGFRVRFETRVRKSSCISRLRFAVDPEIIPGFHFGSGETTDTHTRLDFHLTPACRVVFVKKPSPIGIPAFKVTFEDKAGDEWSERFARAFNFSYLKAEDCRKAADFFLHIISLMEPTKRDD